MSDLPFGQPGAAAPAGGPIGQPVQPEQPEQPLAAAAPEAAVEPAEPADPYKGLTLEVRRLADEGRYVFGVVVKGAFVALADKKLGGIDDDIREAAQPGFKKARADAYANELRDQRG